MKKRSFIFVSGFGWTGASALVDYLKDFDGLAKTPCGEIPFLNALHLLIHKLKKGGSIDLENGRNERIILTITPKDYIGPRKEFFESKIQKFYTHFKLNKLEYISYVKKILLNIDRCIVNENNKELCEHVTNYLLFLDEHIIGEEVFIYDNAIPGQNLSYFSLIDPSKIDNLRIYIMDRDPRDQYYEIMQKYNRGHVSKNNRYIHYLNKVLDLFKPVKNIASSWYFASNYYLKRRDNLVNDLEMIRTQFDDKTVTVLEFGEFVKNINSIRKKLGDELESIFSVKYQGESNFKPKESEKNIGVYKKDYSQNKLGYWWLVRKTKKY